MDAAREPRGPPSRSDLNGGRMVNAIGLVSPVANLALLQLGPREVRWMGVAAGVLLWTVGGLASAAGTVWLNQAAFGLHYVLVVLGLLDPRWPAAVFRAWNAFGRLLGRVVAIPLFALVFYLAVTPIALLLRLLGQDPLRRHAPPGESYWEDHVPPPPERFERQF